MTICILPNQFAKAISLANQPTPSQDPRARVASSAANQMMLANQLMQLEWEAQFGLAKADCDARQKCIGQCWAQVDEGDNLGIKFKMKVTGADTYISGAALCEGRTWEYNGVRRLFGMLGELGAAERGTFLDIGANLGSWTLPVAVHKKHIKVVAFDVSSFCTNMLQESIEANNLTDRVETHRFAIVQDPEAKQSCLMVAEDKLNTSNNIGAEQVNLGDRDFCAEAVPARTLDSFYASNSALHEVIAAKLDCEGCEGQALLGASKFLSESPPCILAMEITPIYLCQAGTHVKDLADFLHQKGYHTETMFNLANSHLSCDEVKKLTVNRYAQDFVYLPQRDLDTCISKFSRNGKGHRRRR